MRFLSSMHPGWNISLFHYRNQGADYGRILVGIQVPAGDEAAFRAFLRHAWPTLASTRRTIPCTACSCAKTRHVATLAAHGLQSLARHAHVQSAARAGLAREAAAAQRNERQPGPAGAAGDPAGPDAEHAQAALPRTATAGLRRRPRSRGGQHPRAAAQVHPRAGAATAREPAATGGVRAQPAARAGGRRLRYRREPAHARPAADAQDRARHAQRARHPRDERRAGTRRDACRHGDRRQAARQPDPLRRPRRGRARERGADPGPTGRPPDPRPDRLRPADEPGAARPPAGHRAGRAERATATSPTRSRCWPRSAASRSR